MKNRIAPTTASLPSMTREMVAQWEAELDDFMVDIQSKLNRIADSITAIDEYPATPNEQIAAIPDVNAFSESLPNVDDPPPIAPSAPATVKDVAESDDANDRIQAIKQKLAARLQGDAT